MAKQNIEKVPPKGPVRFSISLSEEQKEAKQKILERAAQIEEQIKSK